MKLTKKNILAIGAAVMVTASLALATFASAASVPADANQDEAPVAIEFSTREFVPDEGITFGIFTVVEAAD